MVKGGGKMAFRGKNVDIPGSQTDANKLFGFAEARHVCWMIFRAEDNPLSVWADVSRCERKQREGGMRGPSGKVLLRVGFQDDKPGAGQQAVTLATPLR